MTGRGIKHLCDELGELKEAASQDLRKNLSANSSSFLRILEEVTGVENELVQLENHLLSHKRLLKDLIDRIYPKILFINSTIEDPIYFAPSSPSELEIHINDVSEKLDILMLEHKVDEALHLLESAEEHYQSIQLQHHSYSKNEMMLYNSLISEQKSMLIQKFTQIAENERTIAPELQSVLASLCRLGESQLAIHLLLKHYHLRIVTGINNLKCSKSYSIEYYLRELARFVFSMISQAAKSFEKLCGDTSPYTSELMLWVYAETKSFVTFFARHVKSTSSLSVDLCSSIKAVKFAVFYCSLLENQKVVLQPYLVKHLFPCIEEVLDTHINHFKKVISIFSASDSWILEKFHVSEVFCGALSLSLTNGAQPDYCLLTASGQKFLTLLQAFVEDTSPLVALEMGGLVIKELMNLFSEYIVILERALTYETSTIEEDNARIKLAESLLQQVSILANVSALVHFLSTIVKGIFSNNGHMDSQVLGNRSIVHEQHEIQDFLLFIEEGTNKLRNVFCQQLIQGVLSTYHSHEIFATIHYNDQCDVSMIHNPMPSGIYQVLFLELRKIEKLDEENVFEMNWLMELLRELMESMFIWASKNKEINATTEESMSSQTDEAKQFILDVQFLVEVGMYGGYFSDDPLLLLTLMKSTFSSAGLDPFKDVVNDDWAIDAATETIQKLLDIEKTSLHPKETIVDIKEDLHEHENNDAVNVEEDEVAKDELEVGIDAEAASLELEFSPSEDSLKERDYIDIDTLNLSQPTINTVQLENITDLDKAGDAEIDVLSPTSSMNEVGQNSEEIKSKSDE
ncbi:exocyst complex component EXO84B-like isoform X2 [Lotus japonicus]|nr:exocyst complex component EXO84B-like isoform X2 [Lotus japonicus]XP_057422979.1 exocyst complex component EXO84B-like isoform X2 [Lotus japonicus]